MILHYQDGTVYGYHLYERMFSHLKRDGTFWVSGGAYDHGIAAISFDHGLWAYDKFTYCCSVYGEDGERSQEFYVNHAASTQEGFDAAIQRQDGKPDAERFDYIEENVEAVFAQLLTA